MNKKRTCLCGKAPMVSVGPFMVRCPHCGRIARQDRITTQVTWYIVETRSWGD